jgi:peptide/nickel transport system ATP-binding protein
LESILRSNDLTVEYTVSGVRKKAVEGVNLEIFGSGYKLGLVGESGSGKSTLGLALMDLIEPPGKIVAGGVEYMGRDVLRMSPEDARKYRWKEVSMVFQSAMNALSPVKKASDHIAEVISQREGSPKREARERALRLLAEVGIEADFADHYPHELSGGMKQRVMIAMALALSPKLLIADEPTSALDVVIQRQILSLLRREVTKHGLSMVLITHDLPILSRLVDDVAVMFAGEVVEKGPVQKVFGEPKHPYTRELISSLLTLDSKEEALLTNSQTNQFAGAADSGCKYRLRCRYAFERCKTEKPILKDVGSGESVACHLFDDRP